MRAACDDDVWSNLLILNAVEFVSLHYLWRTTVSYRLLSPTCRPSNGKIPQQRTDAPWRHAACGSCEGAGLHVLLCPHPTMQKPSSWESLVGLWTVRCACCAIYLNPLRHTLRGSEPAERGGLDWTWKWMIESSECVLLPRWKKNCPVTAEKLCVKAIWIATVIVSK